jgi:hypothetical protein
MSLKMINKVNPPASEDQSQPVTVLTDQETTKLIKQFLSELYNATGDQFISEAKYLLNGSVITLRITTAVVDPDTFETTTTETDYPLEASGQATVDYDPSSKIVTIGTNATRGNIILEATRDDFPAEGEETFGYIALDTKKLYYWKTDDYFEVVPLNIGTQVLTDTEYKDDEGNIIEVFQLRNPVTGDVSTFQFDWKGDGLKLAFDPTTNIITVSADIVHTNPISTGAGTANDPLSINISTDVSIRGSGQQNDPLHINVQHGEAMSGTGIASDPLILVLEVDGNAIYGNQIYTGLDNQYLLKDGVGSFEMAQLVVQTEFTNVYMHTTATTATSNPYRYKGDFWSKWNLPNGAGYCVFQLLASGAYWTQYRSDGIMRQRWTLAENGYWKPGISARNVLSYNSDSGDLEAAWPLDFQSDYPDQSGYAPEILYDLFNYHSLNNHMADDTRHLTDGERDKWNAKLDDSDLATAVEKLEAADSALDTKYSGITTTIAGNLTAESNSRISADISINARIDGLESLGSYITSVDTYNDTTGGKTSLLSLDMSEFPSVTIGDFVTVRVDETHSNAVTIYRIVSLPPDTQWNFDYLVSSDITNKIDKVDMTMASHTVGYMPTLDAAGMLTGASINPNEFADAESFEEHVNDQVMHVTQTQRNTWDAKASSASVSAERSRAEAAETNLGALITALQALKGYFIGSYMTYAGVPKTSSTAHVGDFCIVLKDEQNGGAIAFYAISTITSGYNLTWALICTMPMTEDVSFSTVPLTSNAGMGYIYRWGRMRQFIVAGVNGTSFTSWARLCSLLPSDAPMAALPLYVRGVAFNSSEVPQTTPVPFFRIQANGEVWLRGTSSITSDYCACGATWFTTED